MADDTVMSEPDDRTAGQGREAIFEPAYIRRLFDDMAGSYERVNMITSFGFSRRWRRQAVERLGARRGDAVADWMTGMGEGWPYLARAVGPSGRISALDLSPRMLRGARERAARMATSTIEIREGNALESEVPDEAFDGVLILFGVKTLDAEQHAGLAHEIGRVLRPGGRFSLIEVSVPPFPPLRVAYLFYLKRIIPFLGQTMLGNPDTYRMLGVFTERFGTIEAMATALDRAGLETERTSHFFGCATGVSGRRPDPVRRIATD